MKEIWKDIKGYEGLYQVSNLGRIKSLNRNTQVLKNYIREEQEKIMSLKKHRDGYLNIGLRKNGKRKWFQIHRLVAEMFVLNPLSYPCVNHKDENKQNNNASNLEWCTYSYNNRYGTRLNRVSQNNKLRREVLKFDLEGNYIDKYQSVAEASKLNKTCASSISECCRNKIRQTKGFVYRFKSEVMLNAN